MQENFFENDRGKELTDFLKASNCILKESVDCNYPKIFWETNGRGNELEFLSCKNVAEYIVDLLTKNHKKSLFLVIGGRWKKKYNIVRVSDDSVIPKTFPESNWNRHIVVLDECGMVYDPVISPCPMELKEYLQNSFFNQEIKWGLYNKVPDFFDERFMVDFDT
jgi:hypothetical protein